ncbi:MAG: hypothetical protein KatS3mg117_1738 [Geminicoccaceae bacterium]|jgi:predicted nucleotidyltransferase|nr:MAG: hypothetical protein KatS3mg117_1738 [Geminicoccaceae bacterium]
MDGSATRRRVLRTLRAQEDRLRREFAIRSLALFGSVARDRADARSDVDLLVEFDRPVGLLHLARTARELEQLVGAPVDLILRRAVLPELRDRISREAVDVF